MEIAKMSAAQLTKAMEKASTESSKITQMMIDAGRGYEYPSDMMKKSDPLSLKYQKSASLLHDLYAEKNRRMTYQGNMRPIKYQGNPTMATEILERGKTPDGRGIRLQKRGKGYDVIVVDPAGINWVYVEKQVSLEKAKNRFYLETMQHKTNPTKRKFSPAQIAAQKLFAERARAGTLGKGKRKANPAKKYRFNVTSKTSPRYVAGFFSTKEAAEDYRSSLNSPFNFTITKKEIDPDVVMRKTKATIERDIYGVPSVKRKPNPDKSKPRAYVKRASQITGAPPSKRLQTRRKMALKAPAGYFPNPGTAMMTGYQVICMHPKKHVVGIFKTMAEAKLVARAMADAKGVAYGVKTVKVHKTHFAV